MEDDARLAEIGKEYGAGRMLTGAARWRWWQWRFCALLAYSKCFVFAHQLPRLPSTFTPPPLPPSKNHQNQTNQKGEVKGALIQILTDLVARHQAARAQVTEAVVDAFMAERPMADALAASAAAAAALRKR
jgi:hypothetical protein